MEAKNNISSSSWGKKTGIQSDLLGQSEARKQRGIEILNTRVPEVVNEHTYLIPSADGSIKYKVRHLDSYSCTCPDFTNRCKEKGLYCKHINAIILFNKMKNKVELDDFQVDDIVNEKNCPKCKSDRVLKKAYERTNQVQNKNISAKNVVHSLFLTLQKA